MLAKIISSISVFLFLETLSALVFVFLPFKLEPWTGIEIAAFLLMFIQLIFVSAVSLALLFRRLWK